MLILTLVFSGWCLLSLIVLKNGLRTRRRDEISKQGQELRKQRSLLCLIGMAILSNTVLQILAIRSSVNKLYTIFPFSIFCLGAYIYNSEFVFAGGGTIIVVVGRMVQMKGSIDQINRMICICIGISSLVFGILGTKFYYLPQTYAYGHYLTTVSINFGIDQAARVLVSICMSVVGYHYSMEEVLMRIWRGESTVEEGKQRKGGKQRQNALNLESNQNINSEENEGSIQNIKIGTIIFEHEKISPRVEDKALSRCSQFTYQSGSVRRNRKYTLNTLTIQSNIAENQQEIQEEGPKIERVISNKEVKKRRLNPILKIVQTNRLSDFDTTKIKKRKISDSGYMVKDLGVMEKGNRNTGQYKREDNNKENGTERGRQVRVSGKWKRKRVVNEPSFEGEKELGPQFCVYDFENV